VGTAAVLARLRESKKKKVRIAMQQQQLGKTATTGAVKKNKRNVDNQLAATDSTRIVNGNCSDAPQDWWYSDLGTTKAAKASSGALAGGTPTAVAYSPSILKEATINW